MFNMEKKKVILVGTGKVYSVFLHIYDKKKVEIVGLIDNNKSKQGKVIDGVKIYAPDEIKELDYDLVIITTAYVDEVKNQLTKLEIESEKIKNFYSIYSRLSPFEDIVWNDVLKEKFNSVFLGQKNSIREIYELKEYQRKNLFLEAKIFANIMSQNRIDTLEEVEFQVYSQFGEDGIIQWLIRNVDVRNKTFVEFGVEDYQEANTRFLLMNNNWTGLVIDGSKENIDKLRKWDLFWKYDLTAVDEFITRDNINQIITDAGFAGEIGILSVDIDGNDYWVLSAIQCVKPCILICEYNNTFGDVKRVTIPYDEGFYRTDSHYSNLYWGASLGAFKDYADQNGYYYFGSNSAGNNAFFVRKDCVDENLIPKRCNEFVISKYRESRSMRGELTYLKGSKKLEAIKDMLLVNLASGKIEKISDIYHI